MTFRPGLFFTGKIPYRLKLLVFIFLGMIINFFTSCKKEDNHSVEPLVSLVSPDEGSDYNVFDTVFIKANIKHNIKILKATLAITDKDSKILVGGPFFTPDNTQFDINAFIVLNNKYIESTENYLLLQVEDENEIFNFWYSIRIFPLDRELKNLIVVTSLPDSKFLAGRAAANSSKTTGRYNLYKVNLSGSYEKLNSSFNEYIGGYTDSRYELFYSCGSESEGISALDIKNGGVKWTIPAHPTGSIPYFISFDGTEGQMATGLFDGSVESYDQNGLILMKSAKITAGRFKAVMNFNKWIVGAFSTFDGTNDKLYIFNNPAGNQYDKINLPGEFIDFIQLDQGTLLIAININGRNEAYTYKFSDKLFYYLNEISTDTISKPAGGEDNIFFISDNDIKWYRPNIGSTVNYLTVPNASAIAFDPLSNLLIVGKGHQLYLYSLPLTQPLATIDLPKEIVDISLMYNK